MCAHMSSHTHNPHMIMHPVGCISHAHIHLHNTPGVFTSAQVVYLPRPAHLTVSLTTSTSSSLPAVARRNTGLMRWLRISPASASAASSRSRAREPTPAAEEVPAAAGPDGSVDRALASVMSSPARADDCGGMRELVYAARRTRRALRCSMAARAASLHRAHG